ncbi:MAG: helix-turn-helix domain-containing protein [Bacteroidota bacterium]
MAKRFELVDLRDVLEHGELKQATHRHDFFFLLTIERGSGWHHIDFEPYRIAAHSVFLLRPGQVHSLLLAVQSEGYILKFSSDFFQHHQTDFLQLLKQLSRRTLFQLREEPYEKLNAILQLLSKEFQQKKEHYSQLLEVYLYALLVELSRNTPPAEYESASQYQLEQLHQLSELVATHLYDCKKVADYTGMMNLSAYQLNKITKTALGKTCSELINEQIVLEAKRHLLATSDQIKAIASHLGFEDVSYFARFFKKHVGVSPMAFRTNFK